MMRVDTTDDSPPPRRAGRPARISRASIIDTVLDLGFHEATTSAVAARLGVDQSTLYGHVRGRQDMLDAAVDAAVIRREWPAPEGHGWRDHLLACADTLWRLFHEQPGLAAYIRGMTTVPPTLADRAMVTVRHLVSLGFELRFAALTVDTIGDIVADSYLIGETLQLEPNPNDGAVQPGSDEGVGTDLAHDLGPAYAAILHDAINANDGSSAWWREKVLLVLDGVAHRMTPA